MNTWYPAGWPARTWFPRYWFSATKQFSYDGSLEISLLPGSTTAYAPPTFTRIIFQPVASYYFARSVSPVELFLSLSKTTRNTTLSIQELYYASIEQKKYESALTTSIKE